MSAVEEISVSELGTTNRLAVGSLIMKSTRTWHVRGGPKDTIPAAGGSADERAELVRRLRVPGEVGLGDEAGGEPRDDEPESIGRDGMSSCTSRLSFSMAASTSGTTPETAPLPNCRGSAVGTDAIRSAATVAARSARWTALGRHTRRTTAR